MRPLLLLAVALLLCACQRQGETFVALGGRLFVFNYRIAQATYLVTLKKTRPIPEGSVAVGEFENPQGGAPLIIRETIFPFWETISLQSPPVLCIRKDRPYRVAIRLEDAKGALLQSLETELTSDVDQTLLPAEPLVLGPLYTQNPDVFKSDGSRDYGSAASCPQ